MQDMRTCPHLPATSYVAKQGATKLNTKQDKAEQVYSCHRTAACFDEMHRRPNIRAILGIFLVG